MALEQARQAPTAAPRAPNTGRQDGAWEPPTWALAALGAAYVLAVAGLVFMPGATFIERLRALDGGICAQLPTHSFFPGGQQLPLCSRNTGIYTGFALGFLTLLGTGRIRVSRLPGLWVAVALLGLVGVMGVDGFNSLFLDLGLPHLYEPQNRLRLMTGLGAGVAMAAFIVPVTNSLLWRVDDARPSFRSFGQLAMVLPPLLLAFLAVGSRTAWLLYPVAILSTLGLVIALTLVNLVFLLSFTPLMGRFTRWRQVFPVFSIGAALAVIELLALFQVKMAALSALAAQLPPSTPLR
ncbi:MAG TPA: DUF2085 domain-containing protein [Ktedonobacterales bacterium]|nr:DUF2085 domain-containing protein [Ktedonobacterales bacterium]